MIAECDELPADTYRRHRGRLALAAPVQLESHGGRASAILLNLLYRRRAWWAIRSDLGRPRRQPQRRGEWHDGSRAGIRFFAPLLTMALIAMLAP